jgi:hypothetical protein
LNNGSEEAALAKMIDVMQNLTTEGVKIETVPDGGKDTAPPGSEF